MFVRLENRTERFSTLSKQHLIHAEIFVLIQRDVHFYSSGWANRMWTQVFSKKELLSQCKFIRKTCQVQREVLVPIKWECLRVALTSASEHVYTAKQCSEVALLSPGSTLKRCHSSERLTFEIVKTTTVSFRLQNYTWQWVFVRFLCHNKSFACFIVCQDASEPILKSGLA